MLLRNRNIDYKSVDLSFEHITISGLSSVSNQSHSFSAPCHVQVFKFMNLRQKHIKSQIQQSTLNGQILSALTVSFTQSNFAQHTKEHRVKSLLTL